MSEYCKGPLLSNSNCQQQPGRTRLFRSCLLSCLVTPLTAARSTVAAPMAAPTATNQHGATCAATAAAANVSTHARSNEKGGCCAATHASRRRRSVPQGESPEQTTDRVRARGWVARHGPQRPAQRKNARRRRRTGRWWHSTCRRRIPRRRSNGCPRCGTRRTDAYFRHGQSTGHCHND